MIVSINMSGSDSTDTELITGRFASQETQTISKAKVIVDMDDVVDRRNEVAQLAGVYLNLTLYPDSFPDDTNAFYKVTGQVTSGTDTEVNISYLVDPEGEFTDSFDPVGPPLTAFADSGSKKEFGDPVNAASQAGSLASKDEYTDYEAAMIGAPDFDARDNLTFAYDARLSGSEASDERFVVDLNYQFLFHLRPA